MSTKTKTKTKTNRKKNDRRAKREKQIAEAVALIPRMRAAGTLDDGFPNMLGVDASESGFVDWSDEALAAMLTAAMRATDEGKYRELVDNVKSEREWLEKWDATAAYREPEEFATSADYVLDVVDRMLGARHEDPLAFGELLLGIGFDEGKGMPWPVENTRALFKAIVENMPPARMERYVRDVEEVWLRHKETLEDCDAKQALTVVQGELDAAKARAVVTAKAAA